MMHGCGYPKAIRLAESRSARWQMIKNNVELRPGIKSLHDQTLDELNMLVRIADLIQYAIPDKPIAVSSSTDSPRKGEQFLPRLSGEVW
jgi:hypothetical protein